jgi:hypothetical protein
MLLKNLGVSYSQRLCGGAFAGWSSLLPLQALHNSHTIGAEHAGMAGAGV